MSRKCQFTLPDDLYERLVTEAVRTSRSQAEYVRRGLDEVLPKRETRAQVRGFEVALFIRRLPRIVRRIHPRLSE